MQIGFLILLFILGACFGSFLCCQARRLHLKSQKKAKDLGPRSICLHCKYQLRWYDNIPIVSWLLLRGKCRKCHHKIGIAELLSELGLALAFLALGTTIDIQSANLVTWVSFAVLLLLSICLSFLAIYDGLYGELPTRYLVISIFLSIIVLTIKLISQIHASGFTASLIYDPLLSILILSGLYLLLYKLSQGKWVGDGDWLLGLAIALALIHPWLSLIALFIANLIACLVMYPILRKKKHAKIYLGPFLVVSFTITYTFSNFFLGLL